MTPADAEIERGAIYTFHSLIADRWRDGPVLLAGDAAHQTPSFVGRGMCAGVRDAANLAVRVGDVIQFTDPEAAAERDEAFARIAMWPR